MIVSHDERAFVRVERAGKCRVVDFEPPVRKTGAAPRFGKEDRRATIRRGEILEQPIFTARKAGAIRIGLRPKPSAFSGALTAFR